MELIMCETKHLFLIFCSTYLLHKLAYKSAIRVLLLDKKVYTNSICNEMLFPFFGRLKKYTCFIYQMGILCPSFCSNTIKDPSVFF